MCLNQESVYTAGNDVVTPKEKSTRSDVGTRAQNCPPHHYCGSTTRMNLLAPDSLFYIVA